MNTDETVSKLPARLMQLGVGMMTFGLAFGFVVLGTPFPRLALTAHIQFMAEGAMVTVAGLVLNANTTSSRQTGRDNAKNIRYTDMLSPLQARFVFWGFCGIWVILLSEVANAFWGAKNVLPLAHTSANIDPEYTATEWQELIVTVAHLGFSPFMLIAMALVGYALLERGSPGHKMNQH